MPYAAAGGERRRSAASQRMAAPVRIRNGSAEAFITCHPWNVNSAPEDSELTTSIVNIAASFTPCTLARSAGVWHSVSSVVAPRSEERRVGKECRL